MVEMRNFTIIPSTFTAVTSSFPSGHASPNTSRITSQGTSTEVGCFGKGYLCVCSVFMEWMLRSAGLRTVALCFILRNGSVTFY